MRFLYVAAPTIGRHWSFLSSLCGSEWYGRRELWLLKEVGKVRLHLSVHGLKALFSRTLGRSVAGMELSRIVAKPQRYAPQESQWP